VKRPTCIDLAKHFGDKYRIGHDQAAITPSERHNPWMKTVLCRRGTVYPYGGDMLAVEIDYRPSTAKKLAAVPGIIHHQAGDAEQTFLFPLALFNQVAAIVKPRRRRKLSAEQKAKLAVSGAAALARYRRR
jgi:hypothetical protein